MKTKEQISIQEQICEYFKPYDNETFIGIVESFVYLLPAKGNTSKILEKFLKDNDIERAYINVVSDMRGESEFFRRASLSEGDIINAIMQAFLNESFNRLRRVPVVRKLKETSASTELKKVKKSIKKLLDPGTPQGFDDAIDELRYIAYE